MRKLLIICLSCTAGLSVFYLLDSEKLSPKQPQTNKSRIPSTGFDSQPRPLSYAKKTPLTNRKIDPSLEDLNALIKEKKYDQARTLLLTKLETHPDDTVFLFALAIVEKEGFNNPLKATGLLEAALASDPSYTEALETLVDLYEETDQRERAGQFLETLPRDSQAAVAMADLYLRWEQPRLALDLLERTSSAPKWLVANAYLEAGRFEQSIEIFTKIYETQKGKKRLWAQLDRAHALLMSGRVAEAKNDIDAVLKVDPTNTHAMELLARWNERVNVE